MLLKKKFDKEVLKRTDPLCLDKKDSILFSHELEKKIESSSVYAISNIILLNSYIYQKNNLLKQFSLVGEYFYSDLDRFKVFLKSIFIKDEMDKAIWITDNWSDGYFHWFGDALPRLLLLNEYWDECPVLLPLKFSRLSYVVDSLTYLGVNFVFKDKVKCKVLYTSDFAAPTGNYRPVLMNELNMFFVPIKKQPFRKIYISRQKASRRRILNENELLPILHERGFEIHYFEDYSLSRQIELISETRFLIGLHGAGLTNMLFMNQGTFVLEIRNRFDSNANCYFSLASDLKIKYLYFLADVENNNTFDTNFNVNCELFTNLLDYNNLNYNIN